MIVGIIGSKDQLVNEYRVMLAEKLLSKSDYDIDSEIRTLELLKAGFLSIIFCYLFNEMTRLSSVGFFWIFVDLSYSPKHANVIFISFLSISRYILERAACRDVKLCSMT